VNATQQFVEAASSKRHAFGKEQPNACRFALQLNSALYKFIECNMDLWLEFEEMKASEAWDAENEFFNMHISYEAKRYALNVWSYGFMSKQLEQASLKMSLISCLQTYLLKLVHAIILKL